MELRAEAGCDRPDAAAANAAADHAVCERHNQPTFRQSPGPLHLIGLNEQFIKSLGPTLALLFGAVALLLAIGCGNVSILLLARGMTRQHEFALRAAVGASPSRIVRQLLTEALLLSVSGAVLGTLLAYRLLAIIVGLLAREAHFRTKPRSRSTRRYCCSVCWWRWRLACCSGSRRRCGISRPDVRDAMGAGTRTVSGSARCAANEQCTHRRDRLRLTLLMMSAAGAAIQSFLKLVQAPLGFDPHHVMSVGLPLRPETYDTIAKRGAFVEALRNQVVKTPGVREVAVSSNATPPDNGFDVPVMVLGQTNEGQQTARWNLVSDGYFKVLRVPLLRGRVWTESETYSAAHVAVVNETFVRKYFPNGDVLGHSVKTTAAQGATTCSRHHRGRRFLDADCGRDRGQNECGSAQAH